MRREDTEQFKKKLLETEELLVKETKDLEQPTDMGNDIDSFEEEAEEAEAFSTQMGMDQPLKNRLARVREALQKIKENRYGICEKCKGEIEQEVLKIDPESEYCKACKLAIR